MQTNGRPIIWLNRERNPGLPEGVAPVTIDERQYEGNFVKIALNVLLEPATGNNAMRPDVLRRWSGPDAGQPGHATR